jgi:preprotein translocase subunit SecE
MADEETKTKEADESPEPQGTEPDEAPTAAGEAEPTAEAESSADEKPADADTKAAAAEGDAAPVQGLQMGSKRFVYAAYLAGAIIVAFILSKAGAAAWHRLGTWKPQIGEARDEYIMPASAIVGGAVAFYYWKRQQTREYVENVADELSKVTWPSRKEVTNSTFVVLVATAFATIFFALMDQFWRYLTNLVYGF